MRRHTHGYLSSRRPLTPFDRQLGLVIDTACGVYVTVESRVCPSVCHVDRQQQRRPAGLLLSALQAEKTEVFGFRREL